MFYFYKTMGTLIAIVLLAACEQPDRNVQDKRPSGPDVNRETDAMVFPSSAPDYTLPSQSSADTVDTPASSNRKANPLSEMTKQEESTSMPMPGQANDHSSDLAKTPKK